MKEEHAVVGKAVRFVGGLDKVTGRAQYLDDIDLPGMLHAKILRSPHAHARIVKVDTSKAAVFPGVKAVLSAADCPSLPFGLDVPDARIFAETKVRYAGDEVAAVAAETPKIAAEALKLIEVQYELLPALFSPEEALHEGAPVIHEDKPGNLVKSYVIERGDVDMDFASCDFVFEEEFSSSRVTPCYLEPFGAIARWEPDGRLTVWTGIQAAFQARAEIARALGMNPSQITVKVPTIGGAFGGKIWIRNFHPIAALLARKAKRPVKFVLTRPEEFVASRHRVPAKIKIKLGMLKDGTMVCKDTTIVADNGAYSWAAPKIVLNMSMRTDCLYRFKSVRTRSYLAYTNTTPTSGFRGYGNAQSHFAQECMIDVCGRKAGLDPVEIRLKNAVRQGDLTLHGWKVRSCGLTECIEKARAAIARVRKPKEDQNGKIKRGVGLACMNHVSGNRAGNNFDGSSSMVRFQEDGKLVLYHGESDMGQGARTVLAQIAAETLGIRPEDVLVMPIDTDVSPFCFGSYSSRVTTVAGKAAYLASLQVREQLLKLAGNILEAAPEDLDIKEGRIFVRGSERIEISVAEVCKSAIRTKTTVGLTAYVAYDPPTEGADEDFYGDYSSAYTYAAQAVEVEVNTETGQIRVLRVAAAHDVGRAINPNGIRGQIYGGVAQGAGWALYENMVYEGGRLQNKSLRNYTMVTVTDMPEVEPIIVETHDPVGPYGAKGIGEPALIPMPPAVANAVEDAVGVRIRDLPITAEKIFFNLHPECEGPGS
ncbi:MAG: xanthine dehydrogenase family protein molybdopterin-binding subunit [Deltaproteobacteria bacterium]|nr:xanthine dehydrogenase family protein molybdopterin-binding subunit [Deltaproteobacteria bacterium]